ncbi:hypothetical protein WCLP8_1800001 [uncultured Gammaproteobacteria bacterium]
MEAVGAVASMVAGGAASAAVGGGVLGVLGAVVGGIVSVGVSYLAREVIGPSQPQQRSYPTPTPPPPRIYTPPPGQSGETVLDKGPVFRIDRHTDSERRSRWTGQDVLEKPLFS